MHSIARLGFLATSCLLLTYSPLAIAEPLPEYLSDRDRTASFVSQQVWGGLGLDTATDPQDGRQASPIRIGQTRYEKGLGHHASGKITVELNGEYTAFRATVGLQWQGGNKGSVLFRVQVDGENVFETGPISDSDPAQTLDIPLLDARELCLIADDAGDGIACDMANWAEARLLRDPKRPRFESAAMLFNGRPAPPPSSSVCGVSVFASEEGPQLAWMQPVNAFVADLRGTEEVCLTIPVSNLTGPFAITVEVALVYGNKAEVDLAIDGGTVDSRRLQPGTNTLPRKNTLTVTGEGHGKPLQIHLKTRATGDEAGIRWRNLHYTAAERSLPIPLRLEASPPERIPPPVLPNPRPAIERALIEWDWRMQDGIATARAPRTWANAIRKTIRRGDALVQDLKESGVPLGALAEEWSALQREWDGISNASTSDDARLEDIWRRVHQLRRRITLANPLAKVGPLLFVKQVPGGFSHQLTQYLGRCSRPGGGIFVLDSPGESMNARELVQDVFPTGSYQQPDIAHDGGKILFAFCPGETTSKDWRTDVNRCYHLYEMNADGSSVKRLTDGAFDDFSPRYLPNGKIAFISTRRLGFHRCGRGPCPVYALALAEADGSNPRPISYHETHEWDPAVLNDGRMIYTRWDYVDRHAVHYQQLWSTRPDGSDVRIFYGNNTLNPVGVWEARPVPNSNKVIATAAAHHAMTAGSIVLLDVTEGIDGLPPITRLTPDVPFPESEAPVVQWHAPIGVNDPRPLPPEAERWPGHCYRTPHALSERYFLAAYSFDTLIGEPNANRPNMFGIYLVDAFGNKELLYRDPNIASLWPVPLRPHRRPADIASVLEPESLQEGTFFLQNVYESWPDLPRSTQIQWLRILQVLPKSTPNINDPRVGLANASPGKQVLGTVPVEPDGSAYFRAPAGVPLAFQALDERGRAVQIMRSIAYLQPGENVSCIGCHEHRTAAPAQRAPAQAISRLPSTIQPGPDGSNPLSYPILVQPVLDRRCVGCHSGTEPANNLDLTGAPEGSFTKSYNALAPRVPHAAWGGGDFLKINSEPLSKPDYFGARASALMDMLLKGHQDVELTASETERLFTWMDANALFYGTFDPDDQARQQRGERISGPSLQ